VSASGTSAPFANSTWPAKPIAGYIGVRNVALARGLNVVDAISASTRIGGGEPDRNLDRSQRKMLSELLPSS
jgi:hypothetical protein